MIYWKGVIEDEGQTKMRTGVQRNTDPTDGDGRVSEKEELVDTGDYDGPNETNYPCAKG
jgi:hypothetical protein